MGNFLTFKKFQTIEQAEELTALLAEQNIPFHIEDNSAAVSDFVVGQDTQPMIILKIAAENFSKAKEFLNRIADEEIKQVESDHYLFAFKDDELLELVMEPDSWNEFDVQLAKKILNTRGIVVNSELEEAFKKKRLKDLSQTEHMHMAWIIAGYILAILGGFIGLIIGLTLWVSKKTLPNGTSVHTYSTEQRTQGKLITAVALIMIAAYIILRVKRQMFISS